MGTFKLVLEDDFGYDFTLIAIHGAIESYYLAYLLNKHLNLRLKRSRTNLTISHDVIPAEFPVYEYHNEKQYATYHLFSNLTKIKKERTDTHSSLFESETAIERRFFLEDLPRVDYLLKVSEEGSGFAQTKTLKELNQIPQIVTAYTVDIKQLKTKENLIFE
ncbi:IPExxxVDY family protein [uncultured Dokdonia sp.]|uniref:IPExxxVDY family protein n=1 Tax=uncultured Dokdonia sp. TaxID=575653 RepID=UPI00260C6B9B|nr:IPExxxVDY family protein [uncultured Dokdonia sp.]